MTALAGSAVLLFAFVANEMRVDRPLLPLSVFEIKGLAAADVTQLIAIAGFFSTFFFLTLYMQNVLGYSAIKTGAAYLPVTAASMVSAGVSSKIFPRTGTRPVLVAGALVAAAGIFYYLAAARAWLVCQRPASRAGRDVASVSVRSL